MENCLEAPDQELLEAWLASVHIVHHVPGRIRLKLGSSHPGQITVTPAQAQAILDVLRQRAEITSVRVNLLARSCVVEYDTEYLPAEAWEDYLQGQATAASAMLKKILMETCREVMQRAQL